MSTSVAGPVSGARAAGFRLTLFGPFKLEQDGRTVPLRTRKEQALLAYLILHPDRHTREALAEIFWGDTPESQARASLRAALADLRGALGPDMLLTDRVIAQFNPSAPISVDVLEFQNHAAAFLSQEQPDPSAFNPGMYEGELLSGHYDDWVLIERERLHRLYMDVLLHRVSCLRSLARYDEAMAAAQHVLTVDRAEERAHQHLIFLYSVTGNRVAAMRQLEICRRSLKEDLDVEPSPETLALVNSITSEPAAEAVHAEYTNLPNPLTSFVGRESELAAVSRLFVAGRAPQGGARLVTLTGAGGSGKTRLAIQLARSLVPSYRHGAWWVDLSSLADASLVPDTVLAALGAAPPPGLPPTQALLGYLRSRTLLLVLDNCEHLSEACAHLVAAILQASPGVQVLATSREPLGVPGEQLWPIPTFAVPAVAGSGHHVDAKALLGYDAVRLFVERARMHKPAFSLGEHNAGQVAEICRRLDGIPLAIELAAARVRTMEVSDVLVRLQNRLRLLASGSTLAPPRQQTLRASIDWSYNLLSPDERLLLQRLAVFVGGCTLAAAEAVGADDALPADEIVDLLVHLVDRSLVIAEGGRYRFLETIREYALERLDDTGEAVVLRERHAGYFSGYLAKRYDMIVSREQHRAIVEITAEIDNIRAAWDWAVTAPRYDFLNRSSGSLTWYYEMHNRFFEGEAVYARAVDALANDPVGDPAVLAEMRGKHGYFLGRLGRLRDGREELERSLAYWRQVDRPDQLALTLMCLGTIVWQEGDYANARAMLEESLRLNRIASDQHLASLCLFFLGLIEHSAGNDAQSDQYLREGLAISRELGIPRMISMTSVFSAPTLLTLGQYGEARERLEEGLPLARTSQDWWLVGTALANLGIVLHAQGDHEGARAALLEAEERTGETGNRWDLAWIEVGLGDVYLALHDATQAEDHYRSALQLAFESAAIPIALDALAGFATLHAQAGDRERALEMAGQVSAHPASTGNARARVTAAIHLLDADCATPPLASAAGTFEDTVHRILAATTS